MVSVIYTLTNAHMVVKNYPHLNEVLSFVLMQSGQLKTRRSYISIFNSTTTLLHPPKLHMNSHTI